MKTYRTLLLAGLGTMAVAPPARAADMRPLLVAEMRGDLTVFFPGGPCSDLTQTTSVSKGILEMTPADGFDVSVGKRFTLTRASIAFAPFTIDYSCAGDGFTRPYDELTVELSQAFPFNATTSAPNVYQATIPWPDVILYEAAQVGDELEAGYKYPVEDVTATLNFPARTVVMTVVLAAKVHVKVGCVPYLGCLINEDRTGTLTAHLTGRMFFPDSDGDGIPDKTDNCRLLANADQRPVATPIVKAPPAVALSSCLDHRLGPPLAMDVCNATVVNVTSDAPAVFPVKPITVTWTGTDSEGRTAAATQTVTVVDATVPVFTSVPADIALRDCGGAKLGLPTATDDCGSAPTITNNAPAKFLVGRKVVTWTAADAAGNRATATQAVTVTDTVLPTVACAPVPLNPTGPGGPGFFKVSGADHCGAPVLRLGSYTVASGATVNIAASTQPGVVLVNTVNGVRYFQAGPGEAAIAATDGSGNVARANCQ